MTFMDAKEEKIVIEIFYVIVTVLMFSVMSIFVRLSVDKAPTSVIFLMRFSVVCAA